MRLFPKTIDFFQIFEMSSNNLMKASSLLVNLMENYENLEARAKEIYELEQDGDMFTHDIMKKLNKTFITPIDREDIHALASRIGLPLSTTHVISSTIMGVGASKRLSAVRWGIGWNIVLAWVLTLPVCAVLSWLICKIAINLF